MKIIVKKTTDGSHTLYVPELDEHYHSINGAYTESMHIFIQMGLKEITKTKKQITIFEVGFGTGLNALLTLEECINSKTKVNYYAIEQAPLNLKIIEEINYCKNVSGLKSFNDAYMVLHTCGWDKTFSIHDRFSFTKIQGDIRTYSFPDNFDLIYFDAFAPDKQPELWSKSVLTKIVEAMNPGGIFVTYSVKGDVRRILQGAGMLVERIPGPPGKRVMLRAIKQSAKQS